MDPDKVRYSGKDHVHIDVHVDIPDLCRGP